MQFTNIIATVHKRQSLSSIDTLLSSPHILKGTHATMRQMSSCPSMTGKTESLYTRLAKNILNRTRSPHSLHELRYTAKSVKKPPFDQLRSNRQRLNWIGKFRKPDRRGATNIKPPPTLKKLNLTLNTRKSQTTQFEKNFTDCVEFRRHTMAALMRTTLLTQALLHYSPSRQSRFLAKIMNLKMGLALTPYVMTDIYKI